jgi:hypothetical protein
MRGAPDVHTSSELTTRTAATTAPAHPSADPDDPTDPEKRNQPNPDRGFGCPGCLATSHGDAAADPHEWMARAPIEMAIPSRG